MTAMILLDRDGTINVDKHYLSKPEQLELLPGAAEGIRCMRRFGVPIVAVTNQSAIARGYFDLDTLDRIHQRLHEILAEHEARLDGIYICPHGPDDQCACRKPAPGMARKAAADFQGNLAQSFVVGDKLCDVELGKSVGATTFLVKTGYGVQTNLEENHGADYVVDDLCHAARIIEGLLNRERKVVS